MPEFAAPPSAIDARLSPGRGHPSVLELGHDLRDRRLRRGVVDLHEEKVAVALSRADPPGGRINCFGAVTFDDGRRIRGCLGQFSVEKGEALGHAGFSPQQE